MASEPNASTESVKDRAKEAIKDVTGEKDIDSLKADLNALRSDLAALTESLKERGYHEARARFDKAKAQASEAREQAAQMAGNVGHQIEERPLTSVLTAFGVGFVLGKLLGR